MTKQKLMLGGIVFSVVIIAFIVFSLVTSQSNTIPEVSQSQFMQVPENLRDFRYCEVIPIFRSGLTIHVEVYNTIGLNGCPTDLWNELDEQAIVDAYGALSVITNGPRYWVMNELSASGASANGKVVDFGGIEMVLAAIIETRLWEGTVGEDNLYTENEVQRETTFIYWADNEVYELVSPEGEIYRMQSYSQIVDPTLTIDDLENLNDRLELPDGWNYQVRILTEDSELTANGIAYVINDNLANSYQKIDP